MYFTTNACNNCGKCWEACPVDCIKHPQNLPFSCTTCGVCASVCPTTAIRKNRFGGYYIDRKRCTLCGLCVKHCPFTFAKIVGGRVKGICVRCGVCVKVCPVNVRVDALPIIKVPIEYNLLLEIATPERLAALIQGKKVDEKAVAVR
ncbi:MAG: 4Fe-4S binding protein [Candidatus Methanomethylicus sp.]|nr:4Fe-4S binding protein [Candidatus Methanomethylicus sp.]